MRRQRSLDGIQLRLPEQRVVGPQFWGARNRYHTIHKPWVGRRPLEGLHAAHRDAHDRSQPSDVQDLCEKAVLCLDHVTDREFWECIAGL